MVVHSRRIVSKMVANIFHKPLKVFSQEDFPPTNRRHFSINFGPFKIEDFTIWRTTFGWGGGAAKTSTWVVVAMLKTPIHMSFKKKFFEVLKKRSAWAMLVAQSPKNDCLTAVTTVAHHTLESNSLKVMEHCQWKICCLFASSLQLLHSRWL